jgi:hypothetical protein
MKQRGAFRGDAARPYRGAKGDDMRRIIGAALLAIVATGCADIPRRELGVYVEAFSKAADASEHVLDDYSAMLKASKARTAAPTNAPYAPYPLELPRPLPPESALDPDAETRRLAFAVVADYNRALVALAEGKSAEEAADAASGLTRSAAAFATALGASAIPGAGALAGIAGTLAGAIERARAREEFKKAIVEGAPLVDGIFNLLAEDVASHYALHVAWANERRLLRASEAIEAARRLRALRAAYAAPSDMSDETEIADAFNAALEPLKSERGVPYPIEFPFAASGSGAAYEPLVASEGRRLVADCRAAASAYADVVEAMRAVGRTLANYRELLEATRGALGDVREALDRPVPATESVGRMLDLAAAIRRDLDAFREAKRLSGD